MIVLQMSDCPVRPLIWSRTPALLLLSICLDVNHLRLDRHCLSLYEILCQLKYILELTSEVLLSEEDWIRHDIN
jgi:hypothetical protein